MNKTRVLAVLISLVLVSSGLLGEAPQARADQGHHYQVAFTGGIGLRMRDAPQMSAVFGATYPEGAWVPADCQDTGEWVTNVNGESSNIWIRSNGGVWWPTAFLYTGVTFWIDGLPICSEKDAAQAEELKRTTKTIGDYHREGQSPMMKIDSNGLSARVYFSKKESKEAAKAFNEAKDYFFWRDTIVCAGFGLWKAPSNPAAFGASIGCSVLMGAAVPADFDYARGAANAAASVDKCYEVRLRRKKIDAEWKAEKWTVTDHKDYCG